MQTIALTTLLALTSVVCGRANGQDAVTAPPHKTPYYFIAIHNEPYHFPGGRWAFRDIRRVLTETTSTPKQAIRPSTELKTILRPRTRRRVWKRLLQDVATAMRSHLDGWWDGVKQHANDFEAPVVGADAENPVTLTACEWADVFIDQQKQVRRGDRKNGLWHIEVAAPGDYAFTLSRWPEESGLALRDGIGAIKAWFCGTRSPLKAKNRPAPFTWAIFSDVIAAASRHKVTIWHKYRNGSWDTQ